MRDAFGSMLDAGRMCLLSANICNIYIERETIIAVQNFTDQITAQNPVTDSVSAQNWATGLVVASISLYDTLNGVFQTYMELL